MTCSNVSEPSALRIERREQQRHKHAGRVVAGEGGIDETDCARRFAKQVGGVRARGDAANERMRAHHEQSSTGAFVGDIAEGEDQKGVVDLKVVDKIAADFPCGLEHDIDGERVIAYGASEARGSELELQRSGFIELGLLSVELLAEVRL